MEGQQVSVMAHYDDVCRGFNYFMNGSDKEFFRFACNQEEIRNKWRKAEEEVFRLQSQLNEAVKNSSKLELQVHHATVMLKDEIKNRQRVQQEKRNLEKQLNIVRDVVSSEKGIGEETREKLAILSHTGRYSRGNFESPGDRLDTINEMNTTASMMLSFDDTIDRTEDELEMSMVRSSRAARAKRASDVLPISEATKRRRSSRENKLEVGSNERVVATTTVTMPKSGPITATAVIETTSRDDDDDDDAVSTPKNRKRSFSEPGGVLPSAPPQRKKLISPEMDMIETSWELPDGRTPVAIRQPSANPSYSAHSMHANAGSGFLRCGTMASGGRINQRQHTFSQKTIIKPENCLPCGNRIKFGKSALKCTDCRGSCHVDCKSRMPMPCIPVVQTPSSKGFVGLLADYAPSTSPMIPALVIHCVSEIERRCMNHKGLYRVNGSDSQVKELKDRLLRGKYQPMISQVDADVLASTLKSFLRSLKEPLVTYTQWESFMKIADMVDEMDVQTAVYSLVPELPQPNRDTLSYIILHLQRVAESPECTMPAPSIAKIFGPTIIGNSSSEPDPKSAILELRRQHGTVEKLLGIPSDYWRRYVDVETDSVSTPMSSRHPNANHAIRSARRGPQFFTSPNLH